jgi:hypothetical protein
MPPLVKLLMLGFAAGFLAVPIFHQGLWWIFNQVGVIPPERAAWVIDPIPPFGVPALISKAFWGGVWGAVLACFLARLEGPGYWASWILVGAFALTLVAFFIVPPIKGEAMPAPFLPRFIVGLSVNGAWGFGTALLLRLLAAARLL